MIKFDVIYVRWKVVKQRHSCDISILFAKSDWLCICKFIVVYWSFSHLEINQKYSDMIIVSANDLCYIVWVEQRCNEPLSQPKVTGGFITNSHVQAPYLTT